ncbi:MAG TPA: HEAT repeat domain-containing protein [Planctomycetaceae bacterium]|nr:HEAT repeat domain-containing protein [Planctomycetaceae bacterium]
MTLSCVTAFAATAECRAQDAAVQQAISRGVAYLQGVWPNLNTGQDTLAAYAMLKAGQPTTAPFVADAVRSVRSRIQDGRFRVGGLIGNYVAAVDLLFLEAVDGEQFAPEIAACAGYIIANQTSGGYWEYPNNNDRGGDTSQLQYCLLGLWGAERAGYEVPAAVWDKAAAWLIRSQRSDGGFAYTPFRQVTGVPPEDLVPSYSMTLAGIGSLALIRHILYPGGRPPVVETAAPPVPSRKFGVLEKVDIGTPEEEQTARAQSQAYQVQTSVSQIDQATRRGMDWLAGRFKIDGAGDRQMYYMYSLERACAFLELDAIAGHDWFAEGVELLSRIQLADGRWTAKHGGDAPATSWGLLFLTRATSKLLGRRIRPEAIGTGLLKGGRGLPSDLSQALLDDGKVAARTIDDPIEMLLAQLEKQEAPQAEVEAVQQALVDSVQLGNREELIGQKDRLLDLARHPHAEVRRTAVWALGHTDDLKLISLMVKSLRDPDVGVRIEAHNALCTLSRKPTGFEGLANDPLAGVAEDAADDQKQAAIEAWTKSAYAKWHAWYLTVRPYDERDDLQEVQPRRAR